MIYIRWNCRDMARGNAELREALTRVSALAEEIDGIAGRLDPRLAGYEGFGRRFRGLRDDTERDVNRLRRETGALDGVIAVYGAAERRALQASEDLPVGIAERSLILEDWFSELMR
jgi:hypothetical protein